jgi:twinkle protein
MNDASPSPSNPSVRFGIATIADGLAAYGLKELSDRHIAAIEGRGLDPELLLKLGVGASVKLGGEAIGIPFIDGGKIVALKHRTLGADKRFTQDVGGKQVLYNVDCLLDPTLKDQALIITEGELDCLAAIQAGFPKAVSVPSGAPSTQSDGERKYAFLDSAMSQLANCKEIILATDDDDPGRILREDLSIRLGSAKCKWIRYPKECKDFNDALRKWGARGVVESVRTAKWMHIGGYFEMSELPELPENPAFDTGIVGLGEHYKLRLGDFCVVTGIPGHGKSSFINEVCGRMAAKYGWRTVFASFEQIPQKDHKRALRSFYSEKLEKMMSRQETADADAWIEKNFGFIYPEADDDDTDVDLKYLLETLSQAVLRKEAKIAVIDPWNEMDHIRGRDETMSEYVGHSIKTLKRWARKYRVHLIVAAHPAKMQRNKDGTIPIPGLYDISDSAHWANKPDVGIVIHRENLADNLTKIRILKSRYADIGRPGEIQGAWDVARTRYTIIEPEAMR